MDGSSSLAASLDAASIGQALLGGILIGLSATIMLLFYGRVAGITGIMVGATFDRVSGDWSWRVLFLAGLLLGGLLFAQIVPEAFGSGGSGRVAVLVVAGVLVGFGTRLGNGCTSGHGVCGVSRLAPRSLVATALFMMAGMATVLVVKRLLGGL